MDRLERSERATGEYPSPQSTICSLEEWRLMGRPAGMAIQVNGDEDIAADLAALVSAEQITITFGAFTDGRGFSLARRLRQRGFEGELIASGNVLPDQWAYLKRSGFTALDSAALAESAEGCVSPGETYQADAVTPLPLFRRRFTENENG